MFKFKVVDGYFFSGNINASAPNEFEVDPSQLSAEQFRDVIEGWLLRKLETEDEESVHTLAFEYARIKGWEVVPSGRLDPSSGLLLLKGPPSTIGGLPTIGALIEHRVPINDIAPYPGDGP